MGQHHDQPFAATCHAGPAQAPDHHVASRDRSPLGHCDDPAAGPAEHRRVGSRQCIPRLPGCGSGARGIVRRGSRRLAEFPFGSSATHRPGAADQNDITSAGQALERLAALESSGGADNLRLQTVSGQLVNYQGLVEQADAAFRRDIALGTGSKGALGFAYLVRFRRDACSPGWPAGRRRPAGQSRSAGTPQPAGFDLGGSRAVVRIRGSGSPHACRHRRRSSLPAAQVPACREPAAAAGRPVGLRLVRMDGHRDPPRRRGFRRRQDHGAPEGYRALASPDQGGGRRGRPLRANTGSVPGTASAGLDAAATQQAGSALDADLAMAESTDGLPIAVPVLAVAIAALGYFGLWLRLNEYRG